MKTLFLVLLSVVLFSCNQNTVEDKIVTYIEHNCKQLPCIVRIKEITKFDWDKMYIFDYGTDIGEIQKVTGTSISVKNPVSRKIAFTKNGNVVHYDELMTNIEGIVDNQVGFDDAGNYSYKVYSVDNAIFEAQKYSQSGKIYYQLKQKNSRIIQ